MEEKIRLGMEAYINQVNDVCEKLLDGINISEGLSLKTKWDFFSYRSEKRKMEFSIDGLTYKFHGIGCTAFNKNFFLDWDFGYRSRWCGIDPWKFVNTLKENASKHDELYDGSFVRNVCEQAILEKLMFKKMEQYYFTIPNTELFIPKFPEEFDEVIVEYYNLRYVIERNKMIDKFVRRSAGVWNQVGKGKYRYTLRFMAAGKEIYCIYYDDVSYPEGAVEIMSDNILRKLNCSIAKSEH